MDIQSYRDLKVWQRGMDVLVEVYRLAKLLPHDEQFGMTSQIRRAVLSVPANIAEGHGRLHKTDFVRFLSIARGSLTELKTYLEASVRLHYLDRDQIMAAWTLAEETGRLLNGLIKSLATNGGNPHRIFEPAESYEAADSRDAEVPNP